MPVAVRFTPAAEADVERAARWYARERPALALEFLDALEAVIDRIASNPRVFPQIIKDARRADMERFPYGVWFRINPDHSIVIACLHHHRDPRLVRQRLREPKP